MLVDILKWTAFVAAVLAPIWGGMLIHYLEEKRKRDNGYKR